MGNLDSVEFQQSDSKSKSISESLDCDSGCVDIKIPETVVNSAARNKDGQNMGNQNAGEKQGSFKSGRKPRVKCGKVWIWGVFAILFVAAVTIWLFYIGLCFQKIKQEAGLEENQNGVEEPVDPAWDAFKEGFWNGFGRGRNAPRGNGKLDQTLPQSLV